MHNIAPYKNAYTGVKFEEFNHNQLYAFTINPDDKLQRWGRSGRDTLHMSDMKDEMKKLHYLRYFAFAEFSPTGRIHYHGWCYGKPGDLENIYLYDLHRMAQIGTFVIKKIDNFQKWDEYITKQLNYCSINSICNVDFEIIHEMLRKAKDEQAAAAAQIQP